MASWRKPTELILRIHTPTQTHKRWSSLISLYLRFYILVVFLVIKLRSDRNIKQLCLTLFSLPFFWILLGFVHYYFYSILNMHKMWNSHSHHSVDSISSFTLIKLLLILWCFTIEKLQPYVMWYRVLGGCENFISPRYFSYRGYLTASDNHFCELCLDTKGVATIFLLIRRWDDHTNTFFWYDYDKMLNASILANRFYDPVWCTYCTWKVTNLTKGFIFEVF